MKQYKNIAIVLVALELFSGCGEESNDLKHNGIDFNTVKSPYTGRIWMDRNVGASRVCASSKDESCYGDYYQYGRGSDGHQKKDSLTRTKQIMYYDQADDKFVLNDSNWFGGELYILAEKWAKLDGSSVCPKNFRIPNEGEFYDELFVDGNSAQVLTEEDLFTSFLKLSKAGYRYFGDGKFNEVGVHVNYWTVGGEDLGASSGGEVGIYDEFKFPAIGRSVRCIKATKEELEKSKESE